MINYYQNCRGNSHGNFMYEVKGANKDKIEKQITGTYVLILDIASWVSVEFYDQVKHIINFFNVDDIDSEKEEFMDIFTFIKNKNVGIDVSSDWFQELWYPLSKKRAPLQTQGILKDTLVQEQRQGALERTLEQKQHRTGPRLRKRGCLEATPLQNVFVSASLLEWFGYKGEYKFQKIGFKKLLDNNNIPYEEIDHRDQRFLEHPV